jgi:hypothetical protein
MVQSMEPYGLALPLRRPRCGVQPARPWIKEALWPSGLDELRVIPGAVAERILADYHRLN